MKQYQINNLFRDRAADSLYSLVDTKLKKEDFTSRKRKKKLLESYLRQIAPFKLNNNEDKPNCPFVTIPGYFWLKRDMLALEKSDSQRLHIIDALAKLEHKTKFNEGHAYLRLDVIAKRVHLKGEPIGGVLQECIYALSYMAKTVTKHALPDHKKKYGISQLVDKELTDTRRHQIADSTKEVNYYFEVYEKHGLEMQTKSAV